MRSLDTPPLGRVMVGGVNGLPTIFAGAPPQASESNVLRQRCDARGFTLLPIENIARQKVAPAFESGRMGPRPPDTPGWGGAAYHKICQPHLPFQALEKQVARALRRGAFQAAAD
jgi:hypothetical protein